MEDREEFSDQEERDPLDIEGIAGPSDQREKREETFEQEGEERGPGESWGASGPERRFLERQPSPRDRRSGFVGTSSWTQFPTSRRETLRGGPRRREGGKDRGSIPKGRIKRIVSERGFGFIETVQGEDLFFHCSKLRDLNFASLHENQLVEFDVAQFPQGVQAVNVRPPDAERGEPEDSWAPANSAQGVEGRSEGTVEAGLLTEREVLFIRLAVSITRGLEREVQSQFDMARQMGLEQSVLSALVDRVSSTNAEACRAITKDA